jgi:pyruvate dehydrogenase E2 component (dihydrolipoamide acetyltransferase)
MIPVAAPEGLGDETAFVAAWLAAEGAAVRAGDPICEITAGKLSYAIEAPADGELARCAAVGAALSAGAAAGGTPPPGAAPPPPRRRKPPVRRPPPPDPIPAGAALDPAELDGLVGAPEPLGPMRALVARRMAVSKLTAPCFYLTVTVDMTGCLALREELKRAGRRATYNDMIVKASALTLAEFPRVASVYTPEGYRARAGIHIGVAVDIQPDGLAVPVVRDADAKPLTAIASEIRDLARRARGKRLLPVDCAEGCFTVSNLGGFDVDDFVAIVNPGESAILAVGRMHDTPMAVGGVVVVRPVARLTLSSDHRTIDGALAARFMQSLKARVEAPAKDVVFSGQGGR